MSPAQARLLQECISNGHATYWAHGRTTIRAAEARGWITVVVGRYAGDTNFIYITDAGRAASVKATENAP